MAVTEYDVGPGAYGVALAADGAVWTSLTGRGELARDGQVSRVRLDTGESRPMVLARGPDGAIWFSRGDGRIGRITPADDITAYPLPTAGAAPVGIHAEGEAVWVHRDRCRSDRPHLSWRADRGIPAPGPVLLPARHRRHTGRRLLGHAVAASSVAWVWLLSGEGPNVTVAPT